MGISSSNFYMLVSVEEALGGFPGRSVLELGNQIMRDSHPLRRTSKQYFTGLEVKEHTYFDINEEDGALPIDLNKLCPEEFWGRYDVVTNFGTAEHIKDQHAVYLNMHTCCKIGGFLVNSIPLEGFWRGHSPYHYSERFGIALSEACGYELLIDEIKPRHSDWFVNFVARKTTEGWLTNGGFPYSEIRETQAFRRNTDNRW